MNTAGFGRTSGTRARAAVASASSSSRTLCPSSAGATGYQRPARCGSLTDGRGPAITVPRSRRRALLVPEGEPQALHVGAGKAGRAAHHLERVEQAAVRDRRLVVAAAHGGLARAPRVQDVVPHRVAGAGVAGGPRPPPPPAGGGAAPPPPAPPPPPAGEEPPAGNAPPPPPPR